MTVYFVEHFLKNKDVSLKLREEFMNMARGKELGELMKVFDEPMFQGKKCLLSSRNVEDNFTLCLWDTPEDVTLAEFQVFVDAFTQDSTTNKVYGPFKPASALGLQNILTFENFAKDWGEWASKSKTQGIKDGELFFVHHNILDKGGYEAWVGKKMQDIVAAPADHEARTTALEMSKEENCLLTISLDEENSMCLWRLPAGTSHSGFQEFIDKFTGTATKNVTYKMDDKQSAGVKFLSFEKYIEDYFAIGAALVKQQQSSQAHTTMETRLQAKRQGLEGH